MSKPTEDYWADIRERYESLVINSVRGYDYEVLAEFVNDYGAPAVVDALKEAQVHGVWRRGVLPYIRKVCASRQKRQQEDESGRLHDMR